ncbi:YqiA/YcfP family alpha/beta fold hydrolase [Halopseudomonas salegens]|uniref:Esterase n=1 Tax=Halopseudomonas salegens TaxID=1434072 RepID=A0A1H2EP43_9GAMM|nr:YqiA/YcfP family alpha/beta fold hydrolase [Halopseudomonas salegens]SDT96814.1 hypothetical protein SAMN05216210_0909 [Halopseudomonas salegens]
MNIHYLHGFASAFDPDSAKLQTLGKLGPVSGQAIDYTLPTGQLIDNALEQGPWDRVELIAGTSMGGWLAAVLGTRLGIPFVAINPSVQPQRTLGKYIGPGVDFQNQPYELTAAAVDSYFNLPTGGQGLILLDEGDEVIDAQATRAALQDHYPVICFPGGNHRFAHMEAALPKIQAFLEGC